jgi:hypothetical protein
MNQELHIKRPCFGSRLILRIGVAGLFFVSMVASVGAATTTGENDGQGGVEQTLVRWQGYLSEKVETLGEAADKVFDADIVFQEINQTSIRLRFDVDAIEGAEDEVEFNPKLDIKWVLPAAERRWSLLIQSEDDFDSDAGNLGDPLLGDDDRGSAALDFAIRNNEKIRTSLAAGLKSDQAYGRFNFRKRFGLGQRVKSRIRNRLTYSTEDSWDNDFKFDVDVPFGKPLPDTREFARLVAGGDRSPWLFRAATRYRWFDEAESDLYEQRFSFFTRVSSRSAIAYEAIARGCSNPNLIDGTEFCKGYDLRLRYKWSPKYNWLSFMVMPVADFPEWNDYDVNAQIRFRMEIWFGRGARAQGRAASGL